MGQLTWTLVALVMFLAALPLLTLGTEAEVSALWWPGLGLAGAAGLIPPLLRFLPPGDGGEGDGDEPTGNEGIEGGAS